MYKNWFGIDNFNGWCAMKPTQTYFQLETLLLDIFVT